MDNPHAINIHCDGAMNYDSRQTGGNGFHIEFPDALELEPISKYLRNDEQGIHRLEMISIWESMEFLLSFNKKHPKLLSKAAGVLIYTDRISVTDEQLLNPWRIQGYRKNGWKTHEGKPVKNKDLLDKIDKTRIKLSREIRGRVEIRYKPEKRNKVADKLSKIGKESNAHSRKIIRKKKRNVIRREFDGQEIIYFSLKQNKCFFIRVYAWESVQDQYEISAEITRGEHKGKVIKLYVSSNEKSDLHRGHYYRIKISNVFNHHVKIAWSKEIKKVKII